MGHLPQESSTELVICPVSPFGQPCGPRVQLIGCTVLLHVLQGGLPGREAAGLQAVSSSAEQLSGRLRIQGLGSAAMGAAAWSAGSRWRHQ